MEKCQDRESAITAHSNDTLRLHHVCGEVVLSEKVQSLSRDTQNIIIQLIREFDDFNPRIDPKGWHDFGSVNVHGEYYYFIMEQIVTRQKRVLARIMRVLHSSEYPKNQDNVKPLSA